MPACALANATPAHSAAVVFTAPCTAAAGTPAAPGAEPPWDCADAPADAGKLRSAASAGSEAVALAEASAALPKNAKSGDSGSGSCAGHALPFSVVKTAKQMHACMAPWAASHQAKARGRACSVMQLCW